MTDKEILSVFAKREKELTKTSKQAMKEIRPHVAAIAGVELGELDYLRECLKKLMK